MTVLALAWAGIIAFCVLMYVVLDGFTLGTGMVMPFLKTEERNIAMSVILPTWDGNQTWLVLGMASLYGAFPLGFSTLLPILYIPLLLMVLSLLFRGVVFEFRLKAGKKGQHYWDMLFFISGLGAAFIQGSILGNVIQGFNGPYQWINSFSLLTALVLIVAYSLLGATRLILKTSGQIQTKMRNVSKILTPLFGFLLVAVSIFSLYVSKEIHETWFHQYNHLLLALFPAVALLTFISLWLGLLRAWERAPYWCTVLIVLCCYAGFGFDIFPYIVPYSITIQEAASPQNTLIFIMVGACVMLPVLLIYTFYSYHIFRGKVNEIIHY